MVAGFVVLLGAATVAVVEPHRQAGRGAAVGAGLGLVNLAIGYLVMRRALRWGMKSAMATLAGGFIARLVVLVALMLVFRRGETIDETACALTFLVFFFVYLGFDLLLWSGRSIDRRAIERSGRRVRHLSPIDAVPRRERVDAALGARPPRPQGRDVGVLPPDDPSDRPSAGGAARRPGAAGAPPLRCPGRQGPGRRPVPRRCTPVAPNRSTA